MFVRFGVFVALLCPLALPGHASVIDFTGMGVSNITEVPDGYAGFNWNLIFYVDANTQPLGSGYEKLATSEGNSDVGMVPEFSTGSFNRTALFVLDSINIAPGWNDAVGVQIAGWRGGVQLYTSNVILNVSTAPTTVQPAWGGAVDAVTIVATSHGTEVSPPYTAAHLGIGNITFSDVPEPGTLLGMGAGLLAISFQVRRRRRAA